MFTFFRALTLAVILVTLAFGMSGCSSKGRALGELQIAKLGEEVFRIRKGDLVDVQVWGEPRMSGIISVRNDGRLTMPLVGDVLIAGKTTEEAIQELETVVGEFVTEPSITVAVSERAPVAYYLSGNFQRPGEYRSDKDIKLLQAIATGGGFAPFADQGNLILIRQSNEGTTDLRYKLNYNRIVDGKQPNPVLHDGDTITVQ